MRLAEHDGDLLHWFYDEGFAPGVRVAVEEAQPAAGQFRVRLGDERAITEKAARPLRPRRLTLSRPTDEARPTECDARPPERNRGHGAKHGHGVRARRSAGRRLHHSGLGAPGSGGRPSDAPPRTRPGRARRRPGGAEAAATVTAGAARRHLPGDHVVEPGACTGEHRVGLRLRQASRCHRGGELLLLAVEEGALRPSIVLPSALATSASVEPA